MISKPPTIQRTVPKSGETSFQMQVDTLLPNDLHNLESPSTYLEAQRAKSSLKKERVFELFFPELRKKYIKHVNKVLGEDKEYRFVPETELSTAENRLKTNEILKKVITSLGYSAEDFKKNPDFVYCMMMVMCSVSGSVAGKIGVQYALYCGSLQKLGTEKHLPFLHKGQSLEEMGCFCMTELTHGSNLQGLLTTATYVHSERSFIIHTPHEVGMKFWVGNLAKYARRAVVFANLLIDGQNYGIHVFLVEIRDIKGELLPGIMVGDIGPKLGLNGIDNGWCLFRRMKIPYDGLLDRFSQISPSGEFISKYKKKSQRFASQLSALITGRLMVSCTSASGGLSTGGIGLRYLSVRKQFGEKKFTETPLIEYPLVQKRLVPDICTLILFDRIIEKNFYLSLNVNNSDLEDPAAKELHAACSVMKVMASSKGMDIALVVRELCGGMGYSDFSRIPSMIKDQNVQMTWEGANDVLIQQTAKFLLAAFQKIMTKRVSPTKSLDFFLSFSEDEEILKKELAKLEEVVLGQDEKAIDVPLVYSVVKRLHQLRLKQISECTAEYFARTMQENPSLFHAFNQALPDHMVAASLSWGFYLCLEHMEDFRAKLPTAESQFCQKAALVAGLNHLRNFAHYLSSAVSLPMFNKLFDIERALCGQIVPDLIVFTDAIMLNDSVLNSVLGRSDGEYAQAMIAKLYSNKLFGRSEDWNHVYPNN